MQGESRPHLRIVGGNEALARQPRVSREVRWPPLRVVVAAETVPAPLPLVAVAARAPRRAAWSQTLMATVVAIMLSSVGQAIAAHW